MYKLITRNIIRKYIILRFALPRLLYFNLHNNTNPSLTFLSVITPQLLLLTPFSLTSKPHYSNFCHYCCPLKPSDSLSSTGFLAVSCPLYGSQPTLLIPSVLKFIISVAWNLFLRQKCYTCNGNWLNFYFFNIKWQDTSCLVY